MDDATFERDFRALYPSVRRFATSLLADPARGEEIAQETMLRLYRAGPSRPAGEEARAWSLRVARNLAINAARRRARWRRLAGNVRLLGPRSSQEPGAVLDRREEIARLWADLGRLPHRQRAALLLREQEGLSYREIADVLRVSLATVKVSIFRARRALREGRTEVVPLSRAAR